jgi:putative flippase GtrA
VSGKPLLALDTYPRPVDALRRLLDGWRRLIRELTKFGIIGAVNTVLDYAIFNALYAIGPLKAQVIATCVAATSSYFMNRHWTFRDRARSGLRREYTLFFLFNLIGLAIALAVLGVTKYGLGYDSRFAGNVAKTIGLVLGTLFRFWSYRKWVFLHPDDVLYEPADAIPARTGSPRPGP